MRRGPVVQQDQRPALPWLLLAAHHQLAELRRRPPVDPTQIVAEAVLPRRRRRPRRPRPPTAPATRRCPPTPAQRHRRKGLDPRRDGDVRDGRERAGQLDQAERIVEPQRQRPHREAAAAGGPQRVGDLAVPPGLHPVEGEPSRRPQRTWDRILKQQQPGRQPGDVLQPQHDARVLADLYPGGLDAAAAGQLVSRPADGVRGRHRQREQQDPDPQQVGLAQHHGAGGRGQARGGEGPASGGQAGDRLAHGRLTARRRGPGSGRPGRR